MATPLSGFFAKSARFPPFPLSFVTGVLLVSAGRFQMHNGRSERRAAVKILTATREDLIAG